MIQDFAKIGLTNSFDLYQALAKAYEISPARTLLDQMYNNPIAEWWMDQWIDSLLKIYYWPMFLAGSEDKINEFWRQFAQGNICRPG